MTERPLQRDKLVAGAEERAGLPVYQAVGEDLDLARAAWAFAHGMTNLELNGRFPSNADLDAAWERGVQAFSFSPTAATTARGRRSGRRR